MIKKYILNQLLTSSEDSLLESSSEESSSDSGSFGAGTPFLAGAPRVPFLAAPACFFEAGS